MRMKKYHFFLICASTHTYVGISTHHCNFLLIGYKKTSVKILLEIIQTRVIKYNCHRVYPQLADDPNGTVCKM